MSDPSFVAPTVPPARIRKRHWIVGLSFIVIVIVPSILAAWYLWERAADRYVSTVGFSVRTEEISSAIELLGGVAQLSGSSSSDTEILYKFIQSQELVTAIDGKLDLRGIWAKGDPKEDPIYAYHAPGTIEDLLAYWRRMVDVYNDSNGLVELQVQAFTPEDAHTIAQMIYDESSDMINRLSAIAREDATQYARDELEKAVEQLKTAREAVTRFRNRTQIVDPTASVQSQMGLLSSLQLQLADALIELDIIQQTANSGDPRIVTMERRVEVIENRINEERKKLGIGVNNATGDSPNAFADLLGEYERLSVDLDFAQESYTAALTTYDTALAEARRQSRYLAAHVRPTIAEAPEHPRRWTLLSLVMLFAFLLWAILVLASYALRDRR